MPPRNKDDYRDEMEEQADLDSLGLYSEKDSSEWDRKKNAKVIDRQKNEKKFVSSKKKKGKMKPAKRLPQNKHRWIKDIEFQWKAMLEEDASLDSE